MGAASVCDGKYGADLNAMLKLNIPMINLVSAHKLQENKQRSKQASSENQASTPPAMTTELVRGQSIPLSARVIHKPSPQRVYYNPLSARMAGSSPRRKDPQRIRRHRDRVMT